MEKWRKKCLGYTMQDGIKGIAIVSILLFLGVCLVGPLGMLLVKAFQGKQGEWVGLIHFKAYLSNPHLVKSVLNTFFVAGVSTCIAVTLAFGFAYVLARKNVPFKSFFRYVGMLPLFAPTMLLGLCLIYLFGNKGIFTALGWKIPLYGSVGIIIAESIYCFPLATSLLLVAFSAADNRLYEAAEAMGTSRIKKLWTITLPNVKYGLISAIFICFTYSFTDFGAPSVVGGNFNVLATDVYKQVIGQQNFSMGAVVGMILLLPSVVAFGVDRVVSKKQAATLSARSTPYQIKKDKKTDTLATLFCVGISSIMLLFLGVGLYASLIKLWPYNLTFTLENYQLGHMAQGEGIKVLKNSLIIAGWTACLGTIVAFSSAYLIEKNKQFIVLKRMVYFLGIMPLAIPGTVVGLSFILFFNERLWEIPGTAYAVQNPLYPLYGTMGIMILANMIHFFSVPFSTALTALKQLDGEFENVSEALGVPFYVTLKRVTLPLCFPALLEMVVYYFVNAMVTVSAIVFLYAPSVKVAAVSIVHMQDAGEVAYATAMSMVILGINLGMRLIYEGVSRKARNKKA